MCSTTLRASRRGYKREYIVKPNKFNMSISYALSIIGNGYMGIMKDSFKMSLSFIL